MIITEKNDKKQAILEALDLLEQVHQALEGIDDPQIRNYVVAQLNVSGEWMGKGIYQELQEALEEVEGE